MSDEREGLVQNWQKRVDKALHTRDNLPAMVNRMQGLLMEAQALLTQAQEPDGCCIVCAESVTASRQWVCAECENVVGFPNLQTQKPVAWGVRVTVVHAPEPYTALDVVCLDKAGAKQNLLLYEEESNPHIVPLYTAPVVTQEGQEPVGWYDPEDVKEAAQVKDPWVPMYLDDAWENATVPLYASPVASTPTEEPKP